MDANMLAQLVTGLIGIVGGWLIKHYSVPTPAVPAPVKPVAPVVPSAPVSGPMADAEAMALQVLLQLLQGLGSQPVSNGTSPLVDLLTKVLGQKLLPPDPAPVAPAPVPAPVVPVSPPAAGS